jgi:8-oxo-dGTP pyrophosphatase MutT (NUDIX family)
VPGGPAPWAAVAADLRRGISLARVRASLAGRDPARPPTPPPAERQAGVLVPLFEEDGEARVVLTRRSARLRSHTGQVAFPGGQCDPGESTLAAALRESAEEIGLDPAAVEVVGWLTPLTPVAGVTAVTPFVGVLPGRPALTPNPAEVERAFDAPLAELLLEEVYREERWELAGRPAWPVHFFEVDGDTIWGATARILHELLQLVTGVAGPAGGPD